MMSAQCGTSLRSQTVIAIQSRSSKTYVPRTAPRAPILLGGARRFSACGLQRLTAVKRTGNGEGQKDNNRNDIVMKKLDAAASSSSNGNRKPSSSKEKNSIDDDDEANKGRRPQNLLQRLAFSIAGLFAALPAWLRTPLAFFNTRILRMLLFFSVGSFLSVLGTLSRGRVGGSGGTSSLPQEVVYSEFLNLVNSGNVRAARFEEGTGRLLFDLRPHSSAAASTTATAASTSTAKSTPSSTPSSTSSSENTATVTTLNGGRTAVPRQFYTRHIPDPHLIPTLMAAGVEFGTVRASMKAAMARVLGTALALWLPLIPMFIVMRSFIEGRNGGNKKPKGDARSTVPPTTFADVAGVGAALEELQEVVACLRDGKRFAKVGAKLPSGVLLCGPPGTGKTLLARAVAGEAGVPFMSISASEFVELFVGRGAARVRELFAEARKRAPCVVFIDELDAVGGKRGAGLNEERDQTLNQMLTELDGFDGRPGVLLLAATNRPDVLDPALMRPGRLSRRVNVQLPDEEGRASIAMVHMRGVPIEGGVEGVLTAAALVARLSSGFSGAELANVVNEAAFLAARRDSDTVGLADLVDAVSRTRFGVGGGPTQGPMMKKIRDWVVDGASLSSQKQMKTQPFGS